MASNKLRSIARRIAKLEAALSPGREPEDGRGRRWSSREPSVLPLQVRFGKLRRLPKDYQGERHIVVTQCLPDQNDQKWVEFAEVAGSSPPSLPQASQLARCLDVVLV
jgi:hypothetical protein